MKPFRAELLLVLILAVPLAFAPAAASAQESEAEGADREVRRTQEIVEIEYADLTALARLLSEFPVHVVGHPELGMLTLRGRPEDVEVAAAAARRLDRPQEPSPTVELTVHVLGASRERDLSGGVPAALEDVAGQLRQVFGYQGVRLLDSLALRVRDRGDGVVRGVIAETGESPAIPYIFGFNRVSLVNGGEDRRVRLDGLLFEAQIGPPDPTAITEGPNRSRTRSDVVQLETDIDVRAGQKAVVGKASSGGAGREALIVVVEARVTD